MEQLSGAAQGLYGALVGIGVYEMNEPPNPVEQELIDAGLVHSWCRDNGVPVESGGRRFCVALKEVV